MSGLDDDHGAASRASYREGSETARHQGSQRFSDIVQAIRTNVLPGLLAIHGAGPRIDPDRIPDEDIVAFTDLVRTSDIDAARIFVRGLRDRGVSSRAILLDLITQSARALGVCWENDSLSFAEVSVAAMRLEQLVIEETSTVPRRTDPSKATPAALLATVPGEQHTLGLLIIDDLFRREGWTTATLLKADASEIVDRVRSGHFSMVGLTLSREALAEDLARLIADVRRASLNKGVLVMVGGRAFEVNPGLSSMVGADLCAVDGADVARHISL